MISDLVQRESCRVHAFVYQSVHTNLSPLPSAVHRPGKNLVHLKWHSERSFDERATEHTRCRGRPVTHNTVPLCVGEEGLLVVAA